MLGFKLTHVSRNYPWGLLPWLNIHLKPRLNLYYWTLAKSSLSIAYFSSVQSFWNFTRSTAVLGNRVIWGRWTSFCETWFYDECLRDILDCNNPKFPSGKIAFVWSTGSHGNCRTHCRLRKAVNCDDRIVRPTIGVIFVHHRSTRPPCGSSTRLARYYIGELPESIRHLAAARIWDFSLMAEQVRSEWGRTKHAWGRCDQVTCLTQPAYFYPWK